MGGRGSNSQTAYQRRLISAMRESIAELHAEVDGVIEGTKRDLWEEYSSGGYDAEYDRRLRELLDDYEPSVTESLIAGLVYPGSPPEAHYWEVMDFLVQRVPDGETVDGFFIDWSILQRRESELEELIAGQLAMRF